MQGRCEPALATLVCLPAYFAISAYNLFGLLSNR
jgi:hypothetical protein